MERLDQGHLLPSIKHQETAMTGPGIEYRPRAPQGGGSTKELFEQLINSFSEHLRNMSSREIQHKS